MMSPQLKHILTKWYNLDTNVETPMAFDGVMETAGEVIDALVALIQEQDKIIKQLSA
jgi:hypothetical protein